MDPKTVAKQLLIALLNVSIRFHPQAEFVSGVIGLSDDLQTAIVLGKDGTVDDLSVMELLPQ